MGAVTLATIPPGTKIAGGGFYLLGLSSSGLAAPASPGDTVVNVRYHGRRGGAGSGLEVAVRLGKLRGDNPCRWRQSSADLRLRFWRGSTSQWSRRKLPQGAATSLAGDCGGVTSGMEGCLARSAVAGSLVLLVVLLRGPVAAQEHEHSGLAGEKLGTVHFPTSCAARAQPAFDRAVALLHSFEFGTAIEAFDAALAADPSCAMAQWGIALCRWSNPFAVGARSAAQLRQGLSAIERARAIRPKTDRERDYVDAAAKLYVDADRMPQQRRLEVYRDAMAGVARRYRNDTEASIFYALALSAAEDLNDKTYAGKLKAVAILEPLFTGPSRS